MQSCMGLYLSVLCVYHKTHGVEIFCSKEIQPPGIGCSHIYEEVHSIFTLNQIICLLNSRLNFKMIILNVRREREDETHVLYTDIYL